MEIRLRDDAAQGCRAGDTRLGGPLVAARCVCAPVSAPTPALAAQQTRGREHFAAASRGPAVPRARVVAIGERQLE